MGALISTKTRALDAAIKSAEDAMATAKAEDRLLTPDERAEVDRKMAEAKAIAGEIEQARAQESLAAELAGLAGKGDRRAPAVGQTTEDAARGAVVARRAVASLGEQFINSEAYLAIAPSSRRSGAWMSPTSELDFATLIDSGGATGGDLLFPEFRPGIVDLLFRRRSVLALFPQASTQSSSVTYFEQTSFTNAAAAVLEGAAKPESAMVFNSVNEPVRKVAHWVPVTDEMLEDVPALRSYIETQLRVGLELAIEDQVLNGNGTAPNISGILDRTLATAIETTTGESLIDAIHRQITALSFNSYVVPDAIVMNPTNWSTVVRSKTSPGGEYLGSGPFANQAPNLWGLPVTVTPAIAVNNVLVGSFQMGAQIFYRNGVGVSVSNSHSDYFIKNITAIRAERRLALAVYRPTAFGLVTDLAAVMSGPEGTRGEGTRGQLPEGQPRPEQPIAGERPGRGERPEQLPVERPEDRRR